MTAPKDADKAAMARIGEQVRARLASDPAVYTVPLESLELFAVTDFLSGDECDRLIAMIDAVALPSPTYDQGRSATYRTSFTGDLDASDSFVRMMDRRICDLMGMEVDWGETVQGQRYFAGQEFRPHFDWFDTSRPYWPRERKRGGQRCWTAMAYLSEVEEGGMTEFPTLGVSIPPQRGMLVLWNNARRDGIANPDALHASVPVVRGEKYVITKWFRTRTWG